MSFIDCVVSNVAIATILALVAAVVGRVTTKPQVTHTLWVLVLVKLVTPPVVHIPVNYTNSEPVALASSVNSSTAMSEPLPSTNSESIEHEAVYRTDVAPLDAYIPTVSYEEAGTSSSVWSACVEAVPWMNVLAGVWVTGSVIWFLLAATRLMRFRQVLRYADPASEDILAEVRTIASRYGLRHLPRVLVVDAKVPPLIGIFGRRATMVLPGGLLSQLGEEGRAGLLAHELAHLKRYDHWFRWFEFAGICIYWWNPVAWWARTEIQQAEEECCDTWVLWAFPDMASQYAQTLVDTVKFLSSHSEVKPDIATAFGQGNSLKRRITMVVNAQTSRRLSWITKTVLVLFAVTVAPLSLSGSPGERTDEDSVNQEGKASSPDGSESATVKASLRSEFPAQVKFDFRGGQFDRDHLLPVGSLSLYSWSLIRPEPRGLRITIPWQQGRDKNTLGIAPTFNVHGDFEITATYELVAADAPETPKPVGGQIYILTNGKHNGASLLRGVMPQGRQVYCLYWAVRDKDGRKPVSKIVPAEARRGRLRFVRQGEILHFLVGDEVSDEFQELAQANFGDEPVSLVRLDSITNGSPCTAETLWKDLVIRAEKVEPVEIPLHVTND